MKRIGITGASGFLATQFKESLKGQFEIIPFHVRYEQSDVDLKGIDVLVHFGGLAHLKELAHPEKYFQSNFLLTRDLADQATKDGVDQFIFISSIKALGNAPTPLNLDSEEDFSKPDPYGESKFQAEVYLKKLKSEMRVSIVRLPLVYGPGVKANMFNLIKLCDSGKWLPFNNIRNKRSFLFSKNLVMFLKHLIERKEAGVFHIADTPPISTSELVTKIRRALKRPRRLFSFPQPFRWTFKLLKQDMYEKLFGSLVLSTDRSFKALEYSNPYSTDEGIRKTVEWYLSQKERV